MDDPVGDDITPVLFQPTTFFSYASPDFGLIGPEPIPEPTTLALLTLLTLTAIATLNRRRNRI